MDHMLTAPGVVRGSWMEHYVTKFPGWEPCLLQWCLQFGGLNVLWRRRGEVIRRKHRPNGINQKSRASLLGNDAFANPDS